jgi:hypothetical protein
MKKLRMTCHSAVLLARRRLAYAEQRAVRLQEEVEVLTSLLLARTSRDRAGNGTAGEPPPSSPAHTPRDGAPVPAGAKSRTPWILAGLVVLGYLAITAFQDPSQGETPAMNIPFLLTAIVATIAVSLHVYTFEVWIWPKLKDEGFPATPFGGPSITRGFYRTVWHFFTVSLVGTIVLMLFFAFGGVIPYVNLIVLLLMVYWILIIIAIFVVGALSLEPGQSYIKTMLKAFQWTLPLVMVLLMYWGTRQ